MVGCKDYDKVVKKLISEHYSDGKAIVFFLLKKGGEGKDYIFGVYGIEKVKASGGDLCRQFASISIGATTRRY